MIGVMCVIGVGTVLPLGSIRPPAPALEVGMAPIYPVVTGNKNDRLPLHTEAVAPEPVVDNPAELTPRVAVVAPPSEARVDHPQSEVISRHWHDPMSSKGRIQKRTNDDAKRSQVWPIERPKQVGQVKQVGEVKACSPDGLALLLRKLNLQPRCD